MKKAENSKKKYNLKTDRFRQIAVWALTFVISLIYVFAGNKIVCRNLDIFKMDGALVECGTVTEIGEYVTESYEAGYSYENSIQYFTARITTGSLKGTEVKAAQTSDNYTNYSDVPVQVGDKVVLYNYGTDQGDAQWIFGGYERLSKIVVFGLVFFGLLLLFGQLKGLNTIISLSFTCLAVFAVFVPSVLAGYNIYFMSILTCVFTIVMTLIITNGASFKSLTTILGCTFGVIVAAVFAVAFDRILRLTGLIDEHSIYLQYLSSGVEIDLRALIFGMIVIGAMGAVMDVAMDISSSLHEIHVKVPDISFGDLVKSGIRIGRDIMGTMANTLVLAYIGSSLCSILLLITYSASLRELLNREGIVVELLQALTGSTAILLTIPLTAIVCAVLYTRFRNAGLEKAGQDAGKTDAETPRKSIIPDFEPEVFYYDGKKK